MAGTNGAKLTVPKIEDAMKKMSGNISQTAKALGVERATLYRYIARSTKLQQILTDTREALVDIAESALLKEVINGNMTAIIWTLKASPAAKARGWSERTEHTGADGSPMVAVSVVEIIRPEAPPDELPAVTP